MLLWLSLILVLAAAATIAFVLRRRWKEIRLLDPNTIRAEQERRARDRIVSERLERRLRMLAAPVRRCGKRCVRRVSRSFQRMEWRLRRMSGMPAEERPPSFGDARRDFSSGRVRRLIREADHEALAGNMQKAERIYLEALKLDVRNFGAYRGLGALYLNARKYDQAKETFDFLVRINGADDGVFAGLGAIAEADGDIRTAEAMRKRAVEANPRSMERRAELIRFCLKQGRAEEAWRESVSALELDPDDPLMLELSAESAILQRDREQAEKRYERLRLMRYDRSRLQRLKERLDAMD
jgi:tetratricopeptide (TPR) repeat protein